ncbi:hypothetical protein EOA36_04810 [Mesorhizobium sp. M8A.F.Ca.ET.021.01.1.1]|nr:hypothetical protein EOA36_04810 [Mesorhizobium sp. M8A.F.Ca.ET.021.01.1.1]
MNRRPAPTLCFYAIPKGNRYAFFPGKPLRTFPGIALGEMLLKFRPCRRAAPAFRSLPGWWARRDRRLIRPQLRG